MVQEPYCRIAFELEFAPKALQRLWRILEAYNAYDYDQARFPVTSPMVGRWIARYIRHRANPRRWSAVDGRTWCRLSVEPAAQTDAFEDAGSAAVGRALWLGVFDRG